MADRYNSNIVSPLHVLLLMIVERLIKIHRYPIYLHYSLLQMCVELKVPEKVPRFSKNLPILIFTHTFFVFSRGKRKQFEFFPEKYCTQTPKSRLKRPAIKQIALWQYADDDIIVEIGSTLDFMACFMRWCWWNSK